jgi:hypothetical protein
MYTARIMGFCISHEVMSQQIGRDFTDELYRACIAVLNEGIQDVPVELKGMFG